MYNTRQRVDWLRWGLVSAALIGALVACKFRWLQREELRRGVAAVLLQGASAYRKAGLGMVGLFGLLPAPLKHTR